MPDDKKTGVIITGYKPTAKTILPTVPVDEFGKIICDHLLSMGESVYDPEEEPENPFDAR